jgi:hypothetical protein
VPNNEHDGLNSLHGGNIGYDARNWTVVQTNTSSITFSLFDPSGFQGSPGSVVCYLTREPIRNTDHLGNIRDLHPLLSRSIDITNSLHVAGSKDSNHACQPYLLELRLFRPAKHPERHPPPPIRQTLNCYRRHPDSYRRARLPSLPLAIQPRPTQLYLP